MKKINTTKIMALLFSACLITSSFVGSTLAKYVSTASANDTARVAKWGVTVDATGSLFGANYVGGDLVANIPTVSNDATITSVNSSVAAEDVVAPGTESEDGLTFAINGQPEVDVLASVELVAKDIYLKEGNYGVMQKATVNETSFAANTYYTKSGTVYTLAATYDASAEYYKIAYSAEVNAGGYYPVVYTWDQSTGTKANDVASVIANKFATTTGTKDATTGATKYVANKKIEANTVLATDLGLDAETLTWAWEFGAAETVIGAPVVADSNDARDTVLGDLMAEGTSNDSVVAINGYDVTVLAVTDEKLVTLNGNEVGSLETSFDLKITVEQVD